MRDELIASGKRISAGDPRAVAATLKAPAWQEASHAARALPDRSVSTLIERRPFEKTQEGPVEGAVKSTRTPGAGIPLRS